MKKAINRLVARIVVPTLALSALSVSIAYAQQGPRPENLVKWRQSAYQVVAWNSARIKASVTGQYDKADVAQAASTLAAVANSGLPKLFAAGTEKARGWHETSAKAEVFSESKRFAELDADFAKAANELAKLAQAGDEAGVKTQYVALNKTCKACHDSYKASE